MIELTAADGHRFSAYRVDPPNVAKGAVVVLQEVFGVNAHIKNVADSLAAQGYVAIAPALFDRVGSDLEFADDEAGLAQGLAAVKQISSEAVLADIQATIDAVKEAGKIAVLGYSWGGRLAYQAGNQSKGLACAIGYYGGGIADDWRGKRKTPTLLHFGTQDAYIPFEQVQMFRANRPDVTVFDYPAGHGFSCETSPGFSADAAQLALQRTLFWIAQYLEDQPPAVLKNAGAYAQQKTDKKKKKPTDDELGPPAE